MRLHAALTLPEPVSAQLAAALEPVHAPSEQLDWHAPEDWWFRLAAFGNVTISDATRLEDVLSAQVERMEAFDLSLAGVIPLPEDGDDSIWVGLDGDVEALHHMTTAIATEVRPHGFTLDRRGFRPRIRLGRVTPYTTLPFLEQLIGLVGDYRGESWQVDHFVLGRRRSGGASDPALGERHRVLALGQPVSRP